MTSLQLVLFYALLSGSTIFLGGLASYYFGAHVKSGVIKAEIIHSITAFGGGILMAAVALVLIPEGMQALSAFPMILSFMGGAVAFYFIDQALEQQGGTLAQLLGMLTDFVPEAIAMGAVFSQNSRLGIFLAVIIGVQNFPEAFNSYLDLKGIFSTKKCLTILFLLSFCGVLSAFTGYYFLSEMPRTVGALMLFSSGGIVYLIFQDIAPLSKMYKKWIPALGASLGFLIGMVGLKVLG